MTPAEAYKILEISPKAKHEEVVSKYRFLALIFHPDKNEDKAAAHENFIRLKDAYDLIMLIRQKGVDEYDDFFDFFAKKAEEAAAEAKAKQKRKEAGKMKREAREAEFEKNRDEREEKFEKYETQAQKLKKEKRRAKAAERKAEGLPKKGEKTE